MGIAWLNACVLVTLVSNNRSTLDQDVYNIIDFSSRTTPNINTIHREQMPLLKCQDIHNNTTYSRNIIYLSNISLVVKPYIVMRRTTLHADVTAQECDGMRLIIKTLSQDQLCRSTQDCHEENLLPHLNDSR